MRTRLELRDLLLTHGYSIVGEASSGRQALELFEKVSPDLTIVDARMPDMDGVATVREIRKKNPNAVMVVSASNGERTTAVEALTAGACEFIIKPFVPRSVLGVLRRVMVTYRPNW